MIVPQAEAVALFLLILSALCLGSWVNLYKLAGKWPFELFYFDFAFGLMLTALIYAFTVGNWGYDGFNFVDDLMHAGKHQWLYAFVAGLIFNLANMLLMAAVSVAGMALAIPIAMGVALLIATIVTYLTRSGSGLMLLGCVMVAIAVVADALAYQRLAVLKHETQAQAGKAKSTRRPWPLKAIVIALVSGLLMGSYARLFEKAREGDVGLGPYSMGVMFALGMFISTFAFNIFFINLPVEGDPVNLQVYLKGKWKHHLLGILGGVIWCTGTVGLLVATSAPESAQVNPLIVAAMWQAVPLVAALWGLLAWKEYKGGDIPVNSLATLMVVLFALGAASIVMSPLYLRKP